MDKLEVGDMLTYEQIAALLDLDHTNTRDRQTISVSARRACQVLAVRAKKVAQLVRGTGYAIADPDSVMVLARRHQSRAVAEVAAGQAKVDTIDTSRLDSTTARLVHATAMGFQRQAVIMRHLDVRQQRLESALEALAFTVHTTASRVEETSTKVDDTTAEMAHLRQRLARLESGLPHGGDTQAS
jgi:hypothetical protein